MATHAGRLSQDQNFNVHFDGSFVGEKTNGSKPQKKGGGLAGRRALHGSKPQKKGGGLAGRRALHDISNSGKPSALQPSRKHNSMNVISIGEDLGAFKTTTFGGKTALKTSDKAQIGGRKALRDLTNSARPSGQQVLKKKSQDKKLISVTEDDVPKAIAEERFLHNHQDCIKAQEKALNRDYFLKTIGLDDDIWTPPLSPRVRPVSSRSNNDSPVKLFEMEELPEMMTGYQSRGHNSPVFGSPKSPYMDLKDYEFTNFTLMESPNRSKY